MVLPIKLILHFLPRFGVLIVLPSVLLFSFAQTADSFVNIPVNTEVASKPSVPVTHNIGVLAYRGDAHARKKWTATVNYLNRAIRETQFKMIPLSLEEMHAAVASQSVSFILTNPGNYVELEAGYGVSRILMLQPLQELNYTNRIGSAIVVRQDRKDLHTIADLQGKTFMAVSRHAFGGFQIVWRELNRHGIDPDKDFKKLHFKNFPQDDIVYEVSQGKVDAGVVKACLLERMIEEGKIEAGILRVLSPMSHSDFECQASTRLYPNWPFSKLRHTRESLAKQVSQALLSLPRNSEATKIGGYGGFTIPMDYQPVHDLFRELKIGPYSWTAHTSLHSLWKDYWQWLVILFFALLWGIWHMARVEHLVTVRTEQLSTTNKRLKLEMIERQKAERKAMLRQAELAHASRISAVGELASGMAHELNQPLSAINSYALGTTWRLQSGEINHEELLNVHQKITTQAERAGTIIQRFLDFLRKDVVVCTEVDVNKAIKEALQLFSNEVRKYKLDIKLQLADPLSPVCAEIIHIEQVILNLLRNSAESMQQLDKEKRHLLIHSEHREGRVWVTVSDSGPGMNSEVALHIFDPFYTTKSDGMGLGLSICRSIIEAQGGRLQLEKNDSTGVSISICWPAFQDNVTDE